MDKDLETSQEPEAIRYRAELAKVKAAPKKSAAKRKPKKK